MNTLKSSGSLLACSPLHSPLFTSICVRNQPQVARPCSAFACARASAALFPCPSNPGRRAVLFQASRVVQGIIAQRCCASFLCARDSPRDPSLASASSRSRSQRTASSTTALHIRPCLLRRSHQRCGVLSHPSHGQSSFLFRPVAIMLCAVPRCQRRCHLDSKSQIESSLPTTSIPASRNHFAQFSYPTSVIRPSSAAAQHRHVGGAHRAEASRSHQAQCK